MKWHKRLWNSWEEVLGSICFFLAIGFTLIAIIKVLRWWLLGH